MRLKTNTAAAAAAAAQKSSLSSTLQGYTAGNWHMTTIYLNDVLQRCRALRLQAASQPDVTAAHSHYRLSDLTTSTTRKHTQISVFS